MYRDNSENRHPKGWISEMFYNFQIEDGFKEADELWKPNLEEPFPLFRARARRVLDRVFAPKNSSVKCKWFIDSPSGLDYLFVASCFYHSPPRMECYDHGSVGTTRSYGSI
jgi:hypothetical protein